MKKEGHTLTRWGQRSNIKKGYEDTNKKKLKSISWEHIWDLIFPISRASKATNLVRYPHFALLCLLVSCFSWHSCFHFACVTRKLTSSHLPRPLSSFSVIAALPLSAFQSPDNLSEIIIPPWSLSIAPAAQSHSQWLGAAFRFCHLVQSYPSSMYF